MPSLKVSFLLICMWQLYLEVRGINEVNSFPNELNKNWKMKKKMIKKINSNSICSNMHGAGRDYPLQNQSGERQDLNDGTYM